MLLFRLENVQTMEELMDVYLHFQVYYADDLPKMQDWKRNKGRKKKKIVMKTVKKKVMRKKKKSVDAEDDSKEQGVEGENEGEPFFNSKIMIIRNRISNLKVVSLTWLLRIMYSD